MDPMALVARPLEPRRLTGQLDLFLMKSVINQEVAAAARLARQAMAERQPPWLAAASGAQRAALASGDSRRIGNRFHGTTMRRRPNRANQKGRPRAGPPSIGWLSV